MLIPERKSRRQKEDLLPRKRIGSWNKSGVKSTRTKTQKKGPKTHWDDPIKCQLVNLKQGRIHGNPVADSMAGAVMQKPLANK